ncbi:ABC transporter ATP-binding protein [Faecalicatena contorta]|uniref:ATP-binding cassette, subfamily B n=1 Tax=Faecalicatena contorta TaxID=39482 RepID=A0A315ZWH1_9FIRM|nr:ABC transporter ATP-binding protein [Faecalicatena contorta]PWJ49991.1 ATP-binding cassette subfamily B protein [Faecalicatena contorta]SUQ14112.1 ATP-binding cassette, subfamily B [Faecalicatena contorta]
MEKEKKKKPLKRLMDFASYHKGKYAASVLLAVIGVSGGLVPYAGVSQIIINLLAETRKDVGFYLMWCGISGVGLIIKTLCMNWSTALSHEATFSVIAEVRTKLVRKLARVPMGCVLETPSGQFKNIIVEKADSLETPLAHVLPEMTSNLLIPLGIIVYMFILDWRMALVSLITLPIGFIFYVMMMRDYREKYDSVMRAGKHMSGTMVEYINGIEVIKAFNQSANSYAKFTDSVKTNVNVVLDWIRSTQVYSAISQGVWPAVLLGVLPVGCLFYINGSLGGGEFITITILSLGISAPILSAMIYTDDIAKIGAVVAEVGQVLDLPELNRPKENKKFENRNIVLEHIGFSYGKEEILSDVNLEIKEGSITAFVGPSGGGKSTIAKLIASFWDVNKGRITLGGIDVRDIPLEQIMNEISYVSQDNYLFNDTIRNNIRMGKPGASDEEVEAAAKASGCQDFIMKLEHGYETIAGGAGGHLSGGERQRIAIARSMLKDANIIIFDEATAYTDPENEAVIQEAVSRLILGKTLIVIAHRLSTITDSDKIVVIENGRVLAEGTHNVLLEECKLYHRMFTAHMEAADAS